MMKKYNEDNNNINNNIQMRAIEDDEDDFLDSLMEDVMGNGNREETPTIQEVEAPKVNGNEVVEVRESGVQSKVSEEKKGAVAPQETKVTPKRGGLLKKFSTETTDDETPKKEDPVHESSPKLAEEKISVVDSTNKEVEDKKGVAPKRGSLLGRFSNKDISMDKEVSSIEKEVSPSIDNPFGVGVKKDSPSINNPFGEEVTKVSSPIDNPFGEDIKKDSPSIDKVEVIVKDVPAILKDTPNTNNEKVEVDDSSGVKDSGDLFDDMLEDIVDIIDEEVPASPSIEEDNSDVVVPLEVPGMNEVVVTPDGRTLSEMLPGLRSGKKTINSVVSDIKKKDKAVEVNGKKFSDNRYTKHVEVIDKEAQEQARRVELSMKFLQRNAQFTEEEKIIMKNLGVTNEQLSQVMKSKDLSMKEKKEVLGLGRYGAEKHFKGRRYKTTVGDTALLEFLVKFKFANTRILRWLNKDNQNRTWRKLNRLKNSGLAESKSIIGIPDLWGATLTGVSIAGYSLTPGLRPMPKLQTISSTMGVNYLAACLWFNTVNVLNLEDFPANNRVISLQNDGRDRVKGEMLVSELEIRSSLGKEINPMSTTMQTLGDERLYDVISANVREAFEDWEENGKVGLSPEFILGNEYMWVLYPTSQLTMSYHVPDLVVKRDRGPNGEPNSIAVELERYEKSSDRYDKIMLAYKLDEHLYKEVVWVTPNARIARALEQAAEEVGFDRYRIVPIITEDGVYDKQDIWMI